MRVQIYSIKNQRWEDTIDTTRIRVITQSGKILNVEESTENNFTLRTLNRMFVNPEASNAIQIDTGIGE